MTPIVQLDQVSFIRQNRPILSDITWAIRPGEQWAIMGLNGSGKTSLLALLMGYEWATHGQVTVLGHLLGQVDVRELRKRIGWASHYLSEWISREHGHDSVEDLIKGGTQAIIGKSARLTTSHATREVLQQFELDHLANNAFQTLSQGEKTRVLLARAWAAKVDLLILDEPGSGLDIKSREHLLGFVQQYLERSIPLIYVTHHPEEILPAFTHALILKQGRTFAQGPVSEVITGPLLSQALEVPLKVHRSHGRYWIQAHSQFQANT